jgi:1-phosphatidylinositol-5-phosphate 4-kinase
LEIIIFFPQDNDFLNHGIKIHIGEEAKGKLLETLAADVEFLTKLHIMDYSLLLGVHDCDAEDQELANVSFLLAFK